MKKYFVFFSLFILPIVAYLFFASGVNNFVQLPTITSSVPDINNWKDVDGKNYSLNNKITVIGFPGKEMVKYKSNLLNLNQKIYNKVREFKDFQLILVLPEGMQSDLDQVAYELGLYSNLNQWHFVFAPEEELLSFHSALGLIGTLDANLGTPEVYIIDKERNLRGRKGANMDGETEYKEGYNTISAADLHNEMGDDIKVILAQYRLALKKNSADRIK